MKIIWMICSLFSALVAVFSVLGVGLSLADVYAITFGGISPGEHMLGDRSAPTLPMALAIFAFWSSLAIGSIMLRRHAAVRAKGLVVPKPVRSDKLSGRS